MNKVLISILILLVGAMGVGSYYGVQALTSQKQTIQALKTNTDSLRDKLDKLSQTVEGKNNLTDKIKNLDFTKYQAVHLTDGTVFFGKISEYTSSYVVLNDIYYIQGGYRDDAAKSFADMQNAQPMQQAISLVKRGNELQGPTDTMTITTSNISFVETMKSDSMVVQAIEAYRANK